MFVELKMNFKNSEETEGRCIPFVQVKVACDAGKRFEQRKEPGVRAFVR